MSREKNFDEMYSKCWKLLDVNRSKILAQVDNSLVEVDYSFVPAKWTETDQELVIQNWVLATHKIVSTFRKANDQYEFVSAVLEDGFKEYNRLED